MITRNAPVRGHADSVTLTSAPPRRVQQPIALPKQPITICGLRLLEVLALVGVSLLVLGCVTLVVAKAMAAGGAR